MFDPQIESRHDRLRDLFAELGDHAALDRPIRSWVVAADNHLPQKVLSDTPRQLIQVENWQKICATPGIGAGRLSKLLDLLERAERSIRHPAPVPAPPPPSDEEQLGWKWEEWSNLFRRHRLQDEPLGRFARSLKDVPSGLWDMPLGTYADRPLAELHSLSGHGPARVRQIVRVISDLGRTLEPAADVEHLRTRVLAERVHAAAMWVESVLTDGSAPDLETLRSQFIEPLLAQLALDLGADESDLIRRRWGVDGRPMTLEELGQDAGLTRERVRQLTQQAEDVFRVRWPEGRHLMDDFHELLLHSGDSEQQLALCRTIMDLCFGLRVARGGSKADVMEAWDRAGRNKLTPMDSAELDSWLASNFPRHSPAAVRNWLAEAGLAFERGDDRLYFSRDPLDGLLLRLHRDPEPVSLESAGLLLELDERAVRGRIDRDPRFIEDEEKRIHAGERFGVVRVGGVWSLRLEPSPTRRAESVPLSDLVHLVVGGLLQRGVADATVWGVHRFANEQLMRVCGATLSAALSPIPLADTLVRLSGGLVSSMRRRRLRWDTADGSIPVRGKRGWVERVVVAAGVPITLDEMRAGLRGHYQDYEDYVVNQLNFDDEDGEDGELQFQTTPGNASRIPKFFVPNAWSLHETEANVGTGARRFVDRIVEAAPDRLYSRSELAHLPWMIALCDRLAPGWPEAAPDSEDARGGT